jgi:hypothetical protein
MSVLIRGMKMPSKCFDCKLAKLWGDCLQCTSLEGLFFTHDYYKRMENCPLVEVKTPHGRLVDADLAMEKLATDKKEAYTKHDVWLKFSTYGAPTVLEAEGEEDNG